VENEEEKDEKEEEKGKEEEEEEKKKKKKKKKEEEEEEEDLGRMSQFDEHPQSFTGYKFIVAFIETGVLCTPLRFETCTNDVITCVLLRANKVDLRK